MMRRLSNNNLWLDEGETSYLEAMVDENIDQLRK